MAKLAGLTVPEACLFPSKTGKGFFAVERFDSIDNQRIHMHTISGLLHADHQTPSLDYESIMKATLYLTRDARECESQFKNAVFNILTHNRDDHGKNFSFLMDSQGVWRVSPAYDLTFSSGPFGEHSTTIMGEGKHPKREHLLKLAQVGGIKKQRAEEIISDVANASLQWPQLAKVYQVSTIQTNLINERLQELRHTLMI